MAKKLFQKGNKAACVNKGKPKHSGRTQAILILDSVLSKPQNQTQLRDALEAHLRKDPVRFFREVVMQLVPKGALDRLEDDAVQAMGMEERESLICDLKLALAQSLDQVNQSNLIETLCQAIDKKCYSKDVTDVFEVSLDSAA